MQESFDQQVSHVDLYHKLGRLEAMMENVMVAVSSFQTAVRDLHTRIDGVEERHAKDLREIEKKQQELEAASSASKGAASAISSLFKDFAIPVAAIALTILVATGIIAEKKEEDRDGGPHDHGPRPVAVIRAVEKT